jgi:hypothetical protein
MLEIAALTYSALMTFVLSSASRNRREGQPHPQVLLYVGYVLLGLTAAGAGLLPVWAAYNPADAAMLSNVSFTL